MRKKAGNAVKITGNAPAGLKDVAKKYGIEFARDCERVLRIETANFTSGQWLGTGTAGMEAGRGSDGKQIMKFPYGWSSLKKWATANNVPESTFFLKSYVDNKEKTARYFIGFRDTGEFCRYFGWFIQNVRGGDVISWYRLPNSGHDAERERYRQSMDTETFKPQFV